MRSLQETSLLIHVRQHPESKPGDLTLEYVLLIYYTLLFLSLHPHLPCSLSEPSLPTSQLYSFFPKTDDVYFSFYMFCHPVNMLRLKCSLTLHEGIVKSDCCSPTQETLIHQIWNNIPKFALPTSFQLMWIWPTWRPHFESYFLFTYLNYTSLKMVPPAWLALYIFSSKTFRSHLCF